MNTVIAFESASLDGLPRVPPDIKQSSHIFNANCGPVALAAVLGTFVIEVMKFFPQFPLRDYTTGADMRYALESCGAIQAQRGSDLPFDGLALIQMQGRWTQPGAPISAQLRYTHWVGCRNDYVFDLNVGDWLEKNEWLRAGAMSWMLNVKGCTGFSVRQTIHVTPRRFEFSPFGRVPARSAR